MVCNIYLDSSKKKLAIANREQWFEKYAIFDKEGCFKKMSNGAPNIINIEGTYYYIEKLYEICFNETYLRMFSNTVKTGSLDDNEYYFYFISKRVKK